MAAVCATRYRARNPRATPLYHLVEAYFDQVKGAVGGALRGAVRLLAGVRRRAGPALSRLWSLRERNRPSEVPGLLRGVPARVLVKDPCAVPHLRGQAFGGDAGEHEVVLGVLDPVTRQASFVTLRRDVVVSGSGAK